MKRRTIAVAGSFARLVGFVFSVSVMIVAVAEGVAGVCACIASERDD